MNMQKVGIVSLAQSSLKTAVKRCNVYTLCANNGIETRNRTRYGFAFYITPISGNSLSAEPTYPDWSAKLWIRWFVSGSYVIPGQSLTSETHPISPRWRKPCRAPSFQRLLKTVPPLGNFGLSDEHGGRHV